jgi:hypothetical protein
MWRTIAKKPVFCHFLAIFFLKNREFATDYSGFTKLCRPQKKSLLRSPRTTLQLHSSCKHRVTNRAERCPRRACWQARIGLNVSCSLAFTLFSFRDHNYFLRLTRGFARELNYAQFFTFESTRNSPALQLLGTHYPRVPKKLQSAKCPSNVGRTKFPTCLHKAPD